MQGEDWVWTAQSALGSEIRREGHEYSLGNTRLTQPPPLRGADARVGRSAVTERKPYGSLRVTDLPKAIKKKKSYFSFLFLPGSSVSAVLFRSMPLLTRKGRVAQPGEGIKTVLRSRKSPRLQPQAMAEWIWDTQQIPNALRCPN